MTSDIFEFDWIANRKLVLNMAIGVIVWGSIGAILTWLAAPPDMPLKSILAGGLVPALTALWGKLSKSPIDEFREQKIAEAVQRGEHPDRRRHNREEMHA